MGGGGWGVGGGKLKDFNMLSPEISLGQQEQEITSSVKSKPREATVMASADFS